jgi:L-threonylcarbamoyladenylate synthase
MSEKKLLQDDISNCITYLEGGMLILYPTDTVWGLGCDAQNDDAVVKIINLKNRSDSKSFVILLKSLEEIKKFATPPSKAMIEYSKKSIKPVTFILNNAKNLSSKVINSDGTVAVRIPGDDFCRELLIRFDKPLVSTSANLSGEPTPGNFMQISEKIITSVDYVVHHSQSDETIRMGSQIIREDESGNIEIIRS